jgi:hypothetical protein
MNPGGSQPQSVVTTQNKDPWSGAQPYLSQALGQAQNLYTTGTGYKPYMGETQAALDPSLASALGQTDVMAHQDMAQGGGFGTGAAGNLALNMINNQGLNPGLQTAAGQFGDIYKEASGQQNPVLQSLIDAQNRRIADKVNSSMAGAGRYGSGAHTDVLARAMSESALPILAQDYAQRQGLRMQSTGGLADLYGQGLQRAGQFSQFLPTIDQMRYAPNQRAMDVGNYYQNRAQGNLAGQISQYNAQQAYPWEQLARYNAIVQGAGGLGGSQISSIPVQQPSTMQRLFGGAAAGAGIGSAFGPAGTAVGGLGGGLLGLL